MNIKPKCPVCHLSEFECSPVSIPNNEDWVPVICKNCGTIVGQMLNGDEKEALHRTVKLLDMEPRLDDVLSILFQVENQLLKKTNGYGGYH
jgi:hypothetical protein